LATCNTGTQELEQGTAAFTAWFRCLRSGVPVFAFEFPCCLLLVVGRLSGSLFFLRNLGTVLVGRRCGLMDSLTGKSIMPVRELSQVDLIVTRDGQDALIE
ncbi:MAG: hypothetical protein MUF54_20100, partial [Polyangiaceae bacterium]|nr:hypothetical protein [Polyangiaceae bacterium]